MPQSSPNSSNPSGGTGPSGNRIPIIIARVVGILCVAGGFVLGIQGLDQPGSRLLPTALGMIVAGLIAQVFALVRSWYLLSSRSE